MTHTAVSFVENIVVACFTEYISHLHHLPLFFVSDHRYAGCYNDSEADRDLPVRKGGPYPPHECAELCMKDGYKFSGVQNGGRCFCGDSYGKHGAADETDCRLHCDGWGTANCGGEIANAVYLSEPGINDSLNQKKYMQVL